MTVNEKSSLFITAKEINLPKGYKVITRLKNGYVLAVRKSLYSVPKNLEENRTVSNND